ncbi:MAG: hypothetical protein MI717_00280, partial [Spirochaetales bacterium]|nr:hypothetical protein [Spirochaetales bacterium]
MIGYHKALTKVSGLESLASVNGNVELLRNDLLVEVTFDALEIVHGHFNVSRSPNLRRMSLPSLTTINGNLSVVDNPNLGTLKMSLLAIVTGLSDISGNNCTDSQGSCIPEWKTTNPLPHCAQARCADGEATNVFPQFYESKLYMEECSNGANWAIPMVVVSVVLFAILPLYFKLTGIPEGGGGIPCTETNEGVHEGDAESQRTSSNEGVCEQQCRIQHTVTNEANREKMVAHVTTSILGIADLSTDLTFIVSTFKFSHNVSVPCTTPGLQMGLLIIAIFSVIFVALSRIISILGCIFVTRKHRGLVKQHVVWRVAVFFILDANFVKDLPWEADSTRRLKEDIFTVEFLTTLSEDLPMLILQLSFWGILYDYKQDGTAGVTASLITIIG